MVFYGIPFPPFPRSRRWRNGHRPPSFRRCPSAESTSPSESCTWCSAATPTLRSVIPLHPQNPLSPCIATQPVKQDAR